MRCRICRTQNNLKYTSQQLRVQLKRNKNKLRLPLSAIPQTSGNICLACDERLQNFHQEDDDGSDLVDVDSNIFHENKKPLVDICVDDDDDDDDANDNNDGGRRLFGMFFNKSQSCNLGSDGDAEVIEVLTSRETTPDNTASFSPNNTIHNMQNSVPVPSAAIPTIIDVIDLIDYEETGDGEGDEKEKKKEDENTNTLKSPIANKTARSEVNETRLLGCLSLISSDSESEIQFEALPLRQKEQEKITESNSILTKSLIKKTKSMTTEAECIPYDGMVECTNNNNLNCDNSSIILQHTLPVCGICGISFLDKQSLLDHMQEHEEYKCPACNNRYQMCLDLVYHMRQKHRSYVGDELCEGARCSQDSAMTIRLRFQQSFTFYECQLCGLIESQFKAHKMHIMQKHADESKSLRDPMMKIQLKCPSCHQNCGTRQIDICRHLLTKHDKIESSKYLHEVEDIESLGAVVKYLRLLQHGARFLSLDTHKQFFIECLLCREAFGTHKTFSKHLNGHNMDEWKMFRAKESQNPISNLNNDEVESSSRRQLKRKIEKRHANKSENDFQTIEMLSTTTEKQQQQPSPKKRKLECEISLKDGKGRSKRIIPATKDSKSKTEQPLIQKITTSSSSNPKTTVNFLTPSNNNNNNNNNNHNKKQKKLKHKVEKDSQNKRGQTKVSIRVKVKPPLRHFPTQKYNCKYCELSFKGFRKLQLHLLNFHRSEEFWSCNNCPRAFTTETSLEAHRAQNICRRKRKWCNPLDENSNKNEMKKIQTTPNEQVEEGEESELKQKKNRKTLEETTSSTIWLKEILQISREKQIQKHTITASEENVDAFFLSPSSYEQFEPAYTICRFCSQLFKNANEFSEHEKTHIAHKDIPWINLVERKWESTTT